MVGGQAESHDTLACLLWGGGEMVQGGRVLAAKTGRALSQESTQWKKELPQVVLEPPHTCCGMCVHTYMIDDQKLDQRWRIKQTQNVSTTSLLINCKLPCEFMNK